jgi:hypothetical protein
MRMTQTDSVRKTLQAIGLLAILLVSCTPTVQVAMPNEPITINLNVRIEHEIQIKVEEELDGIFTADSGLF